MTNDVITKTIEKDYSLDWLLKTLSIDGVSSFNEEVDITSVTSSSPIMKDENKRAVSGLTLIAANYQKSDEVKGFNKNITQKIIDQIDIMINDQVNKIIHNEKFRASESSWLSIEQLVGKTNFRNNIKIDILDITKEELAMDLDANCADVTGSEIFKKIYLSEYDQFGGEPYTGIIGMYDFDKSSEDIDFLSTIGKIGVVSHCPFLGNVSSKFLNLDTWSEINSIKDLDGMMQHPRYRKWNKFRDTDEAVYVGLTMPRYILREPWDPDINPAGRSMKAFKEEIDPLNDEHYLWGFSSLLFAGNMTRSFNKTGWAQTIRGPKAGGSIDNLPTSIFNIRGREEIKPPIECIIPDNKEFSFAKAGIDALIYEKNTSNACFFSSQSVKAPKEFKDPKDSKDSQLLTNLSYTFSVCRIAHYVKAIGRRYIGSTADDKYIESILKDWINQYVTKVVNPDDYTTLVYPFKEAEINVTKEEGRIGWYNCSFKVLPHIQMEGLNVALQLTTRLEKK